MRLVDDPCVDALIRLALAVDLPKGDVTTEACIEPGARSRGAFVAREPCIVAGLEVAARVFSLLDPGVLFRPSVAEGTRVEPKTRMAIVEGSSQAILAG